MRLLLFIVAIFYTAQSYIVVYDLYEQNSLISSVISPKYDFFRQQPHLLIAPFIPLIISVIWFYAYVKVSNLSPLAWITTLMIAVVTPIGAVQLLRTVLPEFSMRVTILNTVIFAFVVTIFFRLIRSKHIFNQPGSPIRSKHLLMIGFFSTVIAAPLFAGLWHVKTTIKNQDYDYARVSEIANFYLYRPNILPQNLQHETVYYESVPDELGTNSVSVRYGSLIDAQTRGESKLIVMHQAAINLDNETTENIGNANSIAVTFENGLSGKLTQTDKKLTYSLDSDKNTQLVITAFGLSRKDAEQFIAGLK